MTPNERQPFVGRACFAHKGGMHVDAVQKAGGAAYEHIVPESVGNERRILISDYSGTSNVREVASDLGYELPKGSPEATAILREVKSDWKIRAMNSRAPTPVSRCSFSALWAAKRRNLSC